ncbi:MAG TPA: hypothetical protein VJB65_01410, partial [Patescibacteria group bacterium]|nr:hypothetical protein [Patescibacteria group bacterium]
MKRISIGGSGKGEKTYTFLLFYNGEAVVLKIWIAVLAALGYEGSTLYASMNLPGSAYNLLDTVEIHGLFLDDEIGYSSKVWVLDELQAWLKMRGIKRAPEYIGECQNDMEFWNSFAKFLKKN